MKKIFFITILIIFKVSAIFAENIEIINDTEGDGLKVVNHSWVKIEYTGSFEDGTVFDTYNNLTPEEKRARAKKRRLEKKHGKQTMDPQLFEEIVS